MSYSTGNPNDLIARSGDLLTTAVKSPKNQDTQMSYAAQYGSVKFTIEKKCNSEDEHSRLLEL